MIYGSAFGWASEVQKPQRFVQLSGGFRSTETPKIHSAIQMGFRSMEKPSFVRPFGWASEVWKNQVSIRCSEERENSKILRVCFRVLKNGKIPRFVLDSEERKTKKLRFVRSGGLPKNENLKIRSGGLLKNENLKIKIRKCGGLLTNENPKIKIPSDERKPKDKDSCGGLPTNENPKIKIRSGGFRLSKERKKLKIRSVSSEEWKKLRFIQWASEKQWKTMILFRIFRKVEPRFVLTNLGLVSQVGSDKQKKTKDSFGGFPKDQDSRTLGEWQRTAAKKSVKVRPALDYKLA
ncbi:unnamed protein product [Rhizophagus irregularis]|nr:unnamed protein product [Rhizophagus irregularis]